MSEEANQGVIDEAVARPTESEEHNGVSNEAEGNQQSKRNDAEYNFSELRRARERDRAELEAVKRELDSFRPKSAPPQEEDDLGISDEDLAEGRHVRSLKKEIKELKDELKRKELSTVEERLYSRYNDYEHVLSPENLELARKIEPELAQSISEMRDPYKQGVAAYKLISRLVKENSLTTEKKKVSENSQKPVSVNAVSKNSAIGNAHLFENGLTKELKSQLWKEMQASMKAG